MSIQDQSRSRHKPSIGVTLQRLFMRLHIFFYRRTDGALGGKLAGRSMLLLTTTGRTSGQKRVTPIFYFSDGDRFILIGSNGGAQTHPQWWRNLQALPLAEIQVGRKQIAVNASLATGEERELLWSKITAKYPDFITYQRRTPREIPVVVLTPR
jgi:deazaflavin-dependent oxidoreductase (nitroreductase family)